MASNRTFTVGIYMDQGLPTLAALPDGIHGKDRLVSAEIRANCDSNHNLTKQFRFFFFWKRKTRPAYPMLATVTWRSKTIYISTITNIY